MKYLKYTCQAKNPLRLVNKKINFAASGILKTCPCRNYIEIETTTKVDAYL